MAATQFAADTPLLVTGLIATAGIFSLWRLWIYAVSFLLIGFLLSHSWRKAGVLTDAELSELRYSGKPALFLRGVKAIYFGVIVNCVVLAMVMFAATRIAEPFLHWNLWLPETFYLVIQSFVEWIGTPLTIQTDSPYVWVLSTNNLISVSAIVLFTTFYSTTGGLRSVVATDVVQFVIMIAATLAYAIFAVQSAGGWENVLSKVEQFYSQPEAPFSYSQLLGFTPSMAPDWTWSLLVVFAFQWLVHMNSDGTGYLAQRTMACRSSKDAKIAAVVFSYSQILLRSLIWIPIGLALIAVFPPLFGSETFTAAREQTFATGIATILPIGFKGLMLTGMLAALASTVDTHLNWGASYLSQDIYGRVYCEVLRKRKPNPRSSVWVARLSNVMLVVISISLMFSLGSIQEAWQISLCFGSALGIPLLLRWFWWRMNAWGELFAVVAGMVLGFWVVFISGDLSEADGLLIVAAGSLAACLTGVFVMGPENKETLKRFYHRVDPAGFWGPVSSLENGKDDQGRRRFRLGVVNTLTCSLSLFCFLVAFGSWLVQAPHPQWAPNLSMWIILNLVIGTAVMPIWLRNLK